MEEEIEETTEIRISDKRQGVFVVDNVVMNHYGALMGAGGIALYVTLCRFANNHSQECYPSIETIKKGTGMDKHTIIRQLIRLEKMRLIKSEKKLGEVTTYTLLEPIGEGPIKDHLLGQFIEWDKQYKKITSVKKRTGIPKNSDESQKLTCVKNHTGVEIHTPTSVKKRTLTNLIERTNNNTPLTPQGEEVLEVWKSEMGTTLRQRLPENVKAGFSLVEDGDLNGLGRFLREVRAARSLKYCPRTFIMATSNFLQIVKNREMVETYIQSQKDAINANLIIC